MASAASRRGAAPAGGAAAGPATLDQYQGWALRRTLNPAIQNTNNVTPCLIYTFEFEVNLLEFNLAYPKDPKTLGEHIRKARMDKGLLIRELAALVGVSSDTVINWELRGVKPTAQRLSRVKGILQF